MLATQHQAERFRVVRNFVPLAQGVEVRPGAVQVLSGDVTDVAVWGERLLAERDGRLVVAVGAARQDVGQAGRFVRAAPFQALTQDGAREDRLYVADGLNPLWYLARRGGTTVRETVINTVLDAQGAPYPLPAASLIGTWRGRLWVDEGPNRLRHCQFDRPAEWDPLWTVQVQGADSDRLRALLPAGDVLLAGLQHAVWGVTGQSQYDWRTAALVSGRGVAGARSMASLGSTALLVARDGLFMLNGERPLSDDVRGLFGVAHVDAAVAVEPRAQRVYVLMGGRLLAVHLESGLWGEVAAGNVRGLFVLQGRLGWYGPHGAWVMAGRDAPDVAIDGTRTPVQATLESWDEVPNRNAGGRALLNRVRLYVQGSPRADAVYTVTADGSRVFSAPLPLSDVTVDQWQAAVAPVDGAGEAWPVPGVLRELVPRLAGTAFRHRIEAPCYMRLDEFRPEFRFRVPE